MDRDGLQDGAEILIDAPASLRGKRMLEAMAECEGCTVTGQYEGRHKHLILYGVGVPHRLDARAEHFARGGHVAMWDLGYWDREECLRLAVDSLHPTAAQLAKAPSGERRRFELRDDARAEGPVLVIGMGRKSASMLGFQPGQWEAKARSELRRRFPNRSVVMRPKVRAEISIEDAMRGCSLVVCRHSNVAVDACVAGIPVECEDGAARALYAATTTPTRDERAEFLRRLGWWNWAPAEAQQAMNWIERVTGCD